MTFEIGPESIKKLNKWLKKRPIEYSGCIGARYTFSFTDTSLGQIVVVRDNLKKEEFDLTDYEGW